MYVIRLREEHFNRRRRQLLILVVDDELMVREALRAVLEYQGHKVHTAASGFQALSLLGTQHFDLVTTDFRMHGMTGDTFAF